MTEAVTLRAPWTPPDTASSALEHRHAQLLTEILARADDVTRQTDAGSWPCAELDRLLNYLHLQLLGQIADEQWLLFRHLHRDRPALTAALQGHEELRDQVTFLADAAHAPRQSPRLLGALVRRLLSTLRNQFAQESRAIHGVNPAPPTSPLGYVPLDCFPALQGSSIDLSTLPPVRGVNAVLARIMKLAPGDTVEVQANTDLTLFEDRLRTLVPGRYEHTLLQHGPPRWRMRILRRRIKGDHSAVRHRGQP
jgi:uncharacterized protein (DUF2249 family)